MGKESIKIIKKILLEDEEARNNDMYLYFSYLNQESKEDKVTKDMFIHPGKYGLSNYNTVSRQRRKLQEKDRETNTLAIQSKKQIKELRKQLEKEYREIYGR